VRAPVSHRRRQPQARHGGLGSADLGLLSVTDVLVYWLLYHLYSPTP
jgi:hypothetical protein